ncbi:hypothetical protein QEH42_gp210 [Microbacterium phage Pumpernickel]|uniref:Uncharacterized protein n=1 Tax=Microbacterium phage Pumpernickel TaxID=2885983 RepID=A0AAE9C2K7_9CAUD|nr:hypothetical protein QEH42_gp210 [Microbacterium phage Pumpernickel]UDL16008.1 hypothetical protein SEA_PUMPERNICKEL_258 [Microbacterium phage Pumpernickel]
MSIEKELVQSIENLKRPTEHGRYAEAGYNDHFNDGLDAAVEAIEAHFSSKSEPESSTNLDAVRALHNANVARSIGYRPPGF